MYTEDAFDNLEVTDLVNEAEVSIDDYVGLPPKVGDYEYVCVCESINNNFRHFFVDVAVRLEKFEKTISFFNRCGVFSRLSRIYYRVDKTNDASKNDYFYMVYPSNERLYKSSGESYEVNSSTKLKLKEMTREYRVKSVWFGFDGKIQPVELLNIICSLALVPTSDNRDVKFYINRGDICFDSFKELQRHMDGTQRAQSGILIERIMSLYMKAFGELNYHQCMNLVTVLKNGRIWKWQMKRIRDILNVDTYSELPRGMRKSAFSTKVNRDMFSSIYGCSSKYAVSYVLLCPWEKMVTFKSVRGEFDIFSKPPRFLSHGELSADFEIMDCCNLKVRDVQISKSRDYDFIIVIYCGPTMTTEGIQKDLFFVINSKDESDVLKGFKALFPKLNEKRLLGVFQ